MQGAEWGYECVFFQWLIQLNELNWAIIKWAYIYESYFKKINTTALDIMFNNLNKFLLFLQWICDIVVFLYSKYYTLVNME